MRRVRSCRLATPLVGAALAISCSGETSDSPPPATLPVPTRSAVEDANMRALALDLAAGRICDELKLLPVVQDPLGAGAQTAQAPNIGRLWVRECAASHENGALALRLAGLGWTWIDQSQAGPFGTSFTARGHLGFDYEVGLTGDVDSAYDPERRVLSVWLTPSEPAAARIEPRRAVSVRAEGDWSELLSVVGGLVGAPVTGPGPATTVLRREGAGRMRQRLSQGFTFTVDLCSGQRDALLGPLAGGQTPERPYADDGGRWLANERTQLRRGGLDAVGPFEMGDATLQLDVDVEDGPGVNLWAYCADDAERLLERYVSRGRGDFDDASAVFSHRASPGPSRAAITARCPVVLLGEPMDGVTTYRFRVRLVGVEATTPLRCED